MDENKRNIFFKVVDKLSDVTISLIIVAIIFVILLQVIARYFGIPAAWTEEVSRYLFIWMMFLGVSTSVRRGELARVTVFFKIMPKIIVKISTYLYFAICFIFFGFMLYTGIDLVKQQLMFNEMGTVIKIHMWVVGLCVPVCGFLGVMNLIACILYNLFTVEGREF